MAQRKIVMRVGKKERKETWGEVARLPFLPSRLLASPQHLSSRLEQATVQYVMLNSTFQSDSRFSRLFLQLFSEFAAN